MNNLKKLFGFEKKLYKLSKVNYAKIKIDDSIQNCNSRMASIAGILMLSIFAIMLVLSFILDTYSSNRVFYLFETIATALVVILNFIFRTKSFALTQIITFVFTGLLYYYGIYVGIIAQQTNYAVTACLTLAVLPLVFIYRPILIFLISTVAMSITVVLMLKFKQSSILIVDLTDTLFSWIFGTALGFSINRMRVENFVREKEIALERDLDGLTGLWNKLSLERRVTDYLSKDFSEGAFFMLDLDNFKMINDNCGHSYGDQVLIEVATCIRSVFDKNSILGRFGGDEFIFFVPAMTAQAAEEIAAKLLKEMYDKILIPYNEKPLTGSIGIAIHKNDMEKDYDRLLVKADRALYITKNNGRSGYTVYNETGMNRCGFNGE